jgi:hypothetical protein
MKIINTRLHQFKVEDKSGEFGGLERPGGGGDRATRPPWAAK